MPPQTTNPTSSLTHTHTSTSKASTTRVMSFKEFEPQPIEFLFVSLFGRIFLHVTRGLPHVPRRQVRRQTRDRRTCSCHVVEELAIRYSGNIRYETEFQTQHRGMNATQYSSQPLVSCSFFIVRSCLPQSRSLLPAEDCVIALGQ